MSNAPHNLSSTDLDNLNGWVRIHGSKAGLVTSRAYELTAESRSNLLPKGTVIVSNGKEKDLSAVTGVLLKMALERGPAMLPTKITGLASKLKEIPDFWASRLAPGMNIARSAPLGKKRTPPKPNTNARNFVVYAIKNRVTGRMYFGSSKTVQRRWADHRRQLNQGIHPNPAMTEDAQEHGIDSFKFFVISRFATSQEMWRREQLLIAMYFNRDACYNVNSAVNPDEVALPVHVDVVDKNGGRFAHPFLTLHAAIRHYRLSKAVVREAIQAGHGRVGQFYFPLDVPITRYLMGRVGGNPRWKENRLPRILAW